MQVKISVSSAAKLESLIDKKLQQINDAKTKRLERVGQMQVNMVQERILYSKVDPNGKPWTPWSMSTLKERKRQGNEGRGLLYRTGALLKSIKFKVSQGLLTVYTDAPYAKFLHFGTPNMPARPFMGFSKDINKILNTLKDAFK